MLRRLAVLALTAPVIFSPSPSHAQQTCGRWSDGFAINQLGGRIHAAVMFDDLQGSGPALFVAGEFGNDDESPGRRGIAKWNGSQFVPVGGGLDGPAWCMTTFDDDGPGPHPAQLVVAGSFSHAGGQDALSIAAWNGSSWSPLGFGIDGTVYAIKSHDDGSGPALFAGGDFGIAGGGFVSSLAAWRNGIWEDVGGGVTLDGSRGYVEALESFQGSLYIAGFFNRAGPGATNAIVKWNNNAFSNLGAGVSYSGFSAVVSTLLAVDLPSTNGPALIIGGAIDTAGGLPSGPVARWSGSAWTSMNSGFSNTEPGAIAVHNDGSGPALYVGGILPSGDGISKWSGSSWQLVASIPKLTGVPLGVDTLASIPGPSGNRLFAGGMFNRINDTPFPCAATLSQNQWTAMGSWGLGLDGAVNAMKVIDLGDGPRLYAVGSFRLAGGIPAAGVARLNGHTWEPLATSIAPDFATPWCLESHNDGSGPALYVGGAFSAINGVNAANVARWRPGSGWSAAGAGLSSPNGASVYSLAVHQDPGAPSPSLFATGTFQLTGATAITSVARLTPSGWTSVGSGPGPSGVAGAFLSSIDPDGPGSSPAKLFFGGAFLPLSSWDGSSWTPDPAPLSGSVISCIAAVDLNDGNGTKLYAGGDFDNPFNGSLGRRESSFWQQVGISPRFPNGGWSGGSPEAGSVKAILPFTDGDPASTRLYMTGIFGHVLSTGYSNVARWDGSQWEGLGGGLASRFPGPDGRGTSMTMYNDGSGDALFVGGKFERYYPTHHPDFIHAPWYPTYNIAKWIPCITDDCRADFDNNGQVDFFDYLDFAQAFSNEDPSADFDNNGQIDFFDYLDFAQAFSAGCD
jgi:hypothetical protein